MRRAISLVGGGAAGLLVAYLTVPTTFGTCVDICEDGFTSGWFNALGWHLPDWMHAWVSVVLSAVAAIVVWRFAWRNLTASRLSRSTT